MIKNHALSHTQQKNKDDDDVKSLFSFYLFLLLHFRFKRGIFCHSNSF